MEQDINLEIEISIESFRNSEIDRILDDIETLQTEAGDTTSKTYRGRYHEFLVFIERIQRLAMKCISHSRELSTTSTESLFELQGILNYLRFVYSQTLQSMEIKSGRENGFIILWIAHCYVIVCNTHNSSFLDARATDFEDMRSNGLVRTKKMMRDYTISNIVDSLKTLSQKWRFIEPGNDDLIQFLLRLESIIAHRIVFPISDECADVDKYIIGARRKRRGGDSSTSVAVNSKFIAFTGISISNMLRHFTFLKTFAHSTKHFDFDQSNLREFEELLSKLLERDRVNTFPEHYRDDYRMDLLDPSLMDWYKYSYKRRKVSVMDVMNKSYPFYIIDYRFSRMWKMPIESIITPTVGNCNGFLIESLSMALFSGLMKRAQTGEVDWIRDSVLKREQLGTLVWIENRGDVWKADDTPKIVLIFNKFHVFVAGQLYITSKITETFYCYLTLLGKLPKYRRPNALPEIVAFFRWDD